MPVDGPTDSRINNPGGGLGGRKNTIKGVTRAELALVNYIDGKGKEETRLMLISGEKKWWFPKGTDGAMQIPSEWICAAVDTAAKAYPAADVTPDGLTGQQSAAAVPDNPVDVMAGDSNG